MQLGQWAGKPRSTATCPWTTHTVKGTLCLVTNWNAFSTVFRNNTGKCSSCLLMGNLFPSCTTDLTYTARLSPLVQNWSEGVPGVLDRLGHKAFLLFRLHSIGMHWGLASDSIIWGLKDRESYSFLNLIQLPWHSVRSLRGGWYHPLQTKSCRPDKCKMQLFQLAGFRILF